MSTLTIAQLMSGRLPAIAASHEGIITEVNTHFEQTFGWSASELVGEPLTMVLPPFFHDSHNLSFARFSATEQSKILNHPLRLKAVTKDGQQIESEHFIIAEKQEGQWRFAATLQPITTESESS